MQLPFQLDFSDKHYHRVLDITCPLLVGGTLVIGTLLVRPEVRRFFFSVSEVGYHSKLTVLVFSFLVFGYVFIAVVQSAVIWSLALAGRLTKNRVVGRFAASPPWLSVSWQRLAREMIGEAIAPDKLSAEHRAEIKEAKADEGRIADSEKKRAEMENIRQLESMLQKSETEWRTWYFILKKYFDLPDQRTREMIYSFGTIHALGWAGIFLMVLSRRFDWLAVAVCGVAVAYGIRGYIFLLSCDGYFGSDSQGVPVAAAVLRELRQGSFEQSGGERLEDWRTKVGTARPLKR